MKFPSCMMLLLLSAQVSRATVLLNDTFDDGERATQQLPGSAAHYHGGSSANQALTVTGNGLQLAFHTTSGQLGQSVAYFTNSGSPVVLGVGEKLSVSMTLRGDLMPSDANGLRIGLFNSGGSRITADLGGTIADEAFSAYTGYALFAKLGAGSNDGTLRQRSNSNTTLWGSGAFANLKSSLGPLGYSADVDYTLTFGVELISEGNLSISFSDSLGNSFVATDTASPYLSFDTFSVFLANGGTAEATYRLDNIVITHAVVPEPAVLGLALAGIAALCLSRGGRGFQPSGKGCP